MGCIHSRKTKSKKDADVLSIYSINEISLSTNSSSTPTDLALAEQQLDLNYSWQCLQHKYFESIRHSQNHEMPARVLSQLNHIFEKIEDNIKEFTNLFYKNLLEMDIGYPLYFKQCCIKNYRTNLIDEDVTEVLTDHILMMFLFHKNLIQSFTNFNNVKTIMNSLTISHILMEISPTDFFFLDCVMEKFLKKTNILNDDNAESIVVYFSYITHLVTSYTHIKNYTDICSARENYRSMKQWEILVDHLYLTKKQALSSKSVGAPSVSNHQLFKNGSERSLKKQSLKKIFFKEKQKIKKKP